MDMKNLTPEALRKYTRTYLFGDEPKNTYPAEWQLHPEGAFTDEFCWADHTEELHTPRDHHHYCCHCGCGQVTNGWYNPGHDQKHYGKLLREWGMAVNNSDRLRIIRNAQKHTTNGVWSKFMNRTGFTIERGYAGEGDITYIAFHDVKSAVTKVGRWYYPVVCSLTGKAYRSSKPIKDTFEAGHVFEIEVSLKDVEYLWLIKEAQEKAKEAVAA
jgi:hypothetical protein